MKWLSDAEQGAAGWKRSDKQWKCEKRSRGHSFLSSIDAVLLLTMSCGAIVTFCPIQDAIGRPVQQMFSFYRTLLSPVPVWCDRYSMNTIGCWGANQIGDDDDSEYLPKRPKSIFKWDKKEREWLSASQGCFWSSESVDRRMSAQRLETIGRHIRLSTEYVRRYWTSIDWLSICIDLLEKCTSNRIPIYAADGCSDQWTTRLLRKKWLHRHSKFGVTWNTRSISVSTGIFEAEEYWSVSWR